MQILACRSQFTENAMQILFFLALRRCPTTKTNQW